MSGTITDRNLTLAGLTPLRRLRSWLVARDKRQRLPTIDASERSLLRRVCLEVTAIRRYEAQCQR